MSKKILVVYENMGMGHLRMANIVKNALQTETDLEIVSQAGSVLFGINDVKVIDKLWNFCLKKNWLRFTDIVINFMLRILFMPLAEVSEINTIHDKLAEIEPDIIVSTADCWNHILSSYALERKIPFYIIITEISVFMDLVNPYATHLCYFRETADAIHSFDFRQTFFATILNRSMKSFQKLAYIFNYYNDYLLHIFKNSIYRNINQKLPINNLVPVKVTGPMADQKHFLPQDPGAIRNKLGLAQDIPTVLILSGSIGGQVLLRIVKNISETFAGPLNILAMCGNDQKAYQKILKLKSSHPEIKIIPYPYQDHMEEFLACSDCVIARPSAGVFIESLLHRVPVITYGNVTTNDLGTLEIINKYRTGEVCPNKKSLVPILRNVLDQKAEYQNQIEQLFASYNISYEAQGHKLQDIILHDKVSPEMETPLINDRFVEGYVV